MKTYAKAPHFLEAERMYKQYGELFAKYCSARSTSTPSPAWICSRSPVGAWPGPPLKLRTRLRRHRRSASAMKPLLRPDA